MNCCKTTLVFFPEWSQDINEHDQIYNKGEIEMAQLHISSKEKILSFLQTTNGKPDYKTTSFNNLFTLLKQFERNNTIINEIVWYTSDLYSIMPSIKKINQCNSIMHTIYIDSTIDSKTCDMIISNGFNLLLRVDSLEEHLLNMLGYPENYLGFIIDVTKKYKNIKFLTCVNQTNLYYFANISDLIRNRHINEWYIADTYKETKDEERKVIEKYISSFINSLEMMQVEETRVELIDWAATMEKGFLYILEE